MKTAPARRSQRSKIASSRTGRAGDPLHAAPGDDVRQDEIQAQTAPHDYRGKDARQRVCDDAGGVKSEE